MTYIVYGGELSLFTRKLEAAMKFYDVPFEFRSKAASNPKEIELRSGTHQVPVLETPENWMIADTTPLLRLLDSRVPARRMFPAGAMGVVVHLLEEYFDEWIARTMVHYRWHYPDSAAHAAIRIGEGDEAVAARIAKWGPKACRATGTESEVQRRAAEDEYARLLDAAERQLGETAFLLGDRPTALDCIVLGGLRAHTLNDPDPAKVVSGYARIVEWTDERADRWEGEGELADVASLPAFATTVLDEMAETYGRFALGNRRALAAGERAFEADVYGEPVSYLARPYPEQSRRMVVERIAGLDGRERLKVEALLERFRLTPVFAA